MIDSEYLDYFEVFYHCAASVLCQDHLEHHVPHLVLCESHLDLHLFENQAEILIDMNLSFEDTWQCGA